MPWDVFISHASEDKASVAAPLAAALEARGLSVWLDRNRMRVGDNIPEAIQAGLAASRVGVVILSPSFFETRWAQAEMHALLNRTIAGKQKLVSVYHNLDPEAITEREPLLATRLGIAWAEGTANVVAAIVASVDGTERAAPAVRSRAKLYRTRRWTLLLAVSAVMLGLALWRLTSVADITPPSAPARTEGLGHGEVLEMMAIPGGKFLMGSPPEDRRDPAEQPQHEVTINSFHMSRFEVTQAQWWAVSKLERVSHDLAPEPAFGKGDQGRPVEGISWLDAVEFCKRISQKSGYPYRLPTEAEWEYAVRAGTKTDFHFGTKLTRFQFGWPLTRKMANCNDSIAGPDGANRGTVVSGSFGTPNAFGLLDVHGNVWEWVQDTWHDDYTGAPADGRAWEDPRDERRVQRGGSWMNAARWCRSATRTKEPASHRCGVVGFRVAYTPPPR